MQVSAYFVAPMNVSITVCIKNILGYRATFMFTSFSPYVGTQGKLCLKTMAPDCLPLSCPALCNVPDGDGGKYTSTRDEEIVVQLQ